MANNSILTLTINKGKSQIVKFQYGKDSSNNFVFNTGDMTSTSGGNIKVSVLKCEIHKQIFAPNRVLLVVSTTGTSASSLYEKMKDASITIDSYKDATTTDATVKDYPIFDCAFQQSGSYVITTITAYSPDKYLTIKQYSQVFTDKTLSEVFALGTSSYTKKCTCVTEPWHLAYDFNYSQDSDKKYKVTYIETAHPYLVQYNESFYDLLCRTSYRSGEYFYYEGENLHIGCGGYTSNNGDIPSDFQLEQSYALQMHSEYGNSMRIDYRNKYTIEKEEIKFEVPDYPYFEEIAATEATYISDYKKVKWAGSITDIHFKPKQFMTRVYKVLSSYRILLGIVMELGINMALELCQKLMFYGISGSGVIWDQRQDDNNGIATKQQGFYGKASNEKAKLGDNNFYANIRKGMDTATQKSITLKMTNNYRHVALGGQYTYTHNTIPSDDKSSNIYIINEVHFVYEQSKNATLRVKASLVAMTDKKTKKPYPAIPSTFTIPTFRQAGPQRAIVWTSAHRYNDKGERVEDKKKLNSNVDSDPCNLGRVRIRYPWQQNDTTRGVYPSPLVRVATPASSDGKGFMAIPQKNDEVMIGYEHNNIECPYVMCSLFNKNGVNSNSTWGGERNGYESPNGHTILFEDPQRGGAGFELLKSIIPSPFISNLVLGLVETHEVAFNKYWRGGGITFMDGAGTYKLSMSASNRNISIASPLGDIKIDALTGITIGSTKGDIKIKGYNIDIEAGNNVNIVSGKAITSGYNKDNNAAGFFTDVSIESLKTLSTMFVDFKMLRWIIRTITQPVEGAITIQSPRDLYIVQGKNSHKFHEKRKLTDTQQNAIQDNKDIKEVIMPLTVCRTALEKTNAKSAKNISTAKEICDQLQSFYQSCLVDDNNLILTEGFFPKDIDMWDKNGKLLIDDNSIYGKIKSISCIEKVVSVNNGNSVTHYKGKGLKYLDKKISNDAKDNVIKAAKVFITAVTGDNIDATNSIIKDVEIWLKYQTPDTQKNKIEEKIKEKLEKIIKIKFDKGTFSFSEEGLTCTDNEIKELQKTLLTEYMVSKQFNRNDQESLYSWVKRYLESNRDLQRADDEEKSWEKNQKELYKATSIDMCFALDKARKNENGERDEYIGLRHNKTEEDKIVERLQPRLYLSGNNHSYYVDQNGILPDDLREDAALTEALKYLEGI